jgi:xanthine dehydrogenase YagT iron-sulfur-binding subunit
MSSDESEENSSHFNRRDFMVGAVVLGAAAASIPMISHALSENTPAQDATLPPASTIETNAAMGTRSLKARFRINGETHDLSIDPRETVLDLLRERLDLTGTKKGCDHGQCGACTVLIDGKRVNSCLSLALQNQNKEILSIESLAKGDQLHPVQAAFVRHDAFQCGFCTPGQIMSAVALMKEPCGKSDNDVRECMSGNICRCGAYRNIVSAIQEVRGEGASKRTDTSSPGGLHASV